MNDGEYTWRDYLKAAVGLIVFCVVVSGLGIALEWVGLLEPPG